MRTGEVWMSASMQGQSRGGNGAAATDEAPPASGRTEPIEKLDEVLVSETPKLERSVEQALEDFVAQANSSFAEDYDGWDIASNIDKFVEQARSKPLEEVEPADPPAPAPQAAAPGVMHSPTPTPTQVVAPTPYTTQPDAWPPVMMHEPTPTPMVFVGITRGMFLGGIVAAGVISAAVAVVVIKFAPSQQPAAPATAVAAPAPTAAPVVQPVAQPAAQP